MSDSLDDDIGTYLARKGLGVHSLAEGDPSQPSQPSQPGQPSQGPSAPSAGVRDTLTKSAMGEIIPPHIQATMDEAGIKPGESDDMLQLIRHGVNPLTNPKAFVGHFKALASQQDGGKGILRTWGPIEPLREALYPEVRQAKLRQAGIMEMGTYLTKEMMKLQASQMGAPQTLGDAQSLLPGIIRPTANQMMGTGQEAPVTGASYGPNPEIMAPNPQAPLTLPQQVAASHGLQSLGQGQLTDDGTGNLTPTALVTAQGKQLTPEQFAQLQNASGIIPPGQAPYIPTTRLPASSANEAINVRARSQMAQDKPPDLNNRLESLVVQESVKPEYGGVPLNARHFARQFPEKFAELRQQAEIKEPRELYQYQLTEQGKKQIAVAGPIVGEQAEAHRNQPVLEPQLWRDPVTGQAASPQMTENQARQASFVKLRPDQVETYNQLTTIDAGLQEVKEIAQGLYKPETGSVPAEILRTLGQRAYLAYLRSVGDQRVVKLDSIITRLTAPLVKSQGDEGNIAIGERQMFGASLVNNNASLEAITGNLDNVIAMTKQVRKLMGFKSREEFVHSLIEQGMDKQAILRILKKKGL